MGTYSEHLPRRRAHLDVGANANAVLSILATLRSVGVPATFFLTGGFVNGFPMAAGLIAVVDRVGNHSADHFDVTTLSTA